MYLVNIDKPAAHPEYREETGQLFLGENIYVCKCSYATFSNYSSIYYTLGNRKLRNN